MLSQAEITALVAVGALSGIVLGLTGALFVRIREAQNTNPLDHTGIAFIFEHAFASLFLTAMIYVVSLAGVDRIAIGDVSVSGFWAVASVGTGALMSFLILRSIFRLLQSLFSPFRPRALMPILVFYFGIMITLDYLLFLNITKNQSWPVIAALLSMPLQGLAQYLVFINSAGRGRSRS